VEGVECKVICKDTNWRCPCLKFSLPNNEFCGLLHFYKNELPPATCPHADALKQVLEDPTLVLLAFPEVVARAIWRDRGTTVVATDVKGEE